MHDPLLVRGGEPPRDLHRQVQGRGDVEAAALQAGAQALAFDQLHRDVEVAFGLADLVDDGDVGVGDGGRPARLAKEALAGRGVAAGVRQQLERDSAAQRRVLGAVDDAHAPLADPSEDAEVRDGGRVRLLDPGSRPLVCHCACPWCAKTP